MFINENFLALQNNYLFTEIEKRVNEYKKNNTNKHVIKLGVGDVSQPIPQIIADEMKKAADEMTNIKTFHGYGPETGYDFLKQTILENEYKNISLSEIFISDGIASDIGNILDLFSEKNTVAITDPVYPEYLDTNIMNGRQIIFLPCVAENNFVPPIPDEKVDLIYICNPNNPMGTAINKNDLQKWVDYAVENNSVILYDGAYEKFISSDNVPHSIYEIPNAKKCAIEFRSFSKSAGFTGLRCSYTIVPNELVEQTKNISLNKLWNRRQCTKTNGVSYIIQRAAQAIYSHEGKKNCAANIKYYMDNAKIIYDGLKKSGYETYGGIDAPYIWFKIPEKFSCWDWFDYWLKNLGIVGTPGIGFGKNGQKYFRLSAFGDRNETLKAMDRILKQI